MITQPSTNGNFSQGIFQTTFELTPAENPLPSPLIALVITFNKIHRIWRTFRLTKIYSNPDNFLKIAAGHTANYVFGDSTMLRMSALCVLIATRILECVNQLLELQTSWSKLVSAFKDHYPTPIKVKWDTKPEGRFFSTSTLAAWKYRKSRMLDRLQRITIATLALIKDAFILSMRFTDTIETFYLSPETRNEGINLFFLNGTRCIDELSKNREKLIEGLTENAIVIDKILTGIRSPLKTAQLIENAKKAMEKTEAISQTIDNVSQSTGNFFSTLIHKWGFEGAGYLGLQSFIPAPKLSYWDDWNTNEKTERYPDPKLLRRM